MLVVEELYPDDSRLPEYLDKEKGIKFPDDAGALFVRAHFNLDSDKGKEAYSNAKFFGLAGEWSIRWSPHLRGRAHTRYNLLS